MPGWSGRADLAQAHLHLAAGHARRGGGPGLRSWLHAVAAECLARSGRVADAVVQIERARETLAAGGAHDDPWWLDFYDPRRLDGFDAAVGLATAHAVLSRDATLRDARHARDRVERALRLLPQPAEGPGLTPQDCVTLLARAVGTALVGDDDGALRLVETAASTNSLTARVDRPATPGESAARTSSPWALRTWSAADPIMRSSNRSGGDIELAPLCTSGCERLERRGVWGLAGGADDGVSCVERL